MVPSFPGLSKYPIGYLPPKTYAFLVQIQQEYKLSIKEVQRIFLNKVACDLGFKCNHERIGYAKSNKEPYCKDCWTRLRKDIKPTYVLGSKLIKGEFRYVEKKTFLDDFYTEENKKQKQNQNCLDDHEIKDYKKKSIPIDSKNRSDKD